MCECVQCDLHCMHVCKWMQHHWHACWLLWLVICVNIRMAEQCILPNETVSLLHYPFHSYLHVNPVYRYPHRWVPLLFLGSVKNSNLPFNLPFQWNSCPCPSPLPPIPFPLLQWMLESSPQLSSRYARLCTLCTVFHYSHSLHFELHSYLFAPYKRFNCWTAGSDIPLHCPICCEYRSPHRTECRILITMQHCIHLPGYRRCYHPPLHTAKEGWDTFPNLGIPWQFLKQLLNTGTTVVLHLSPFAQYALSQCLKMITYNLQFESASFALIK